MRARGTRSSPERRPAIWPWVLMPLVALALFFLLRMVRHSTRMLGPGPAVATGSASSP